MRLYASFSIHSKLTAFPIPMRGNEDLSRALVAADDEFPIPMRGNELAARERNHRAALVSNPHEG